MRRDPSVRGKGEKGPRERCKEQKRKKKGRNNRLENTEPPLIASGVPNIVGENGHHARVPEIETEDSVCP